MATRRPLLRTLAAALLPAAGASHFASALFGLRVASPAVVFLTTLFLIPSKSLPPPSPSPITSVIVQSRVPRRSLILALLSLAAFTFLVDGFTYVLYAILNAVWRPGTGLELAALLGLIAYSALAALGTFKDINNIEIWSRKPVKAAIFIALALDVAQVVLLIISVQANDSRHICTSSKLSTCIPEFIHFFVPIIRVVILLFLLFVLFSPLVVYRSAESQSETVQAERAPLVGQSSLLQGEGHETVSGGESSKYGTFGAHAQPEANAVTACPVPESSFAILWRLCPYVLPAKGLISLIALLHLLARVTTPLLPLSLGAAVNGFVSTPSTPIPLPFGSSPYPYIFVFVLLCLLVSDGGIPIVIKGLVSRVGAHADDAFSSRYVDHVFALALGSGKAEVPEDATTSGAISKALHAVSVLAAAVGDDLIGVVVLGVLFGWEFGLAVLIALGIYGYVICLAFRPSILANCPAKPCACAFVQALLGSAALLLGSLYIAKGVAEGVWSAGAWVAWVWYWGILFLPLTQTPSLRVATDDAKSIFKVLDRPVGVVGGKGCINGTAGLEVKFDNVFLTYPYTDAQDPVPALSGVSFVLPAASVTAIVNEPGPTRSSILKALYRLYDVDSGSIYLNGSSIYSLSLASLRSVIAVVPDISPEARAKAFSRALEKDAKVVLVEGTLERSFIGARTVIWEARGLEGLDGVDQILVLRDGKLVEVGSFKELVQADGFFASLWADHVGSGVPIPGSSSATVSGAVEGYDTSIVAQPVDGQTAEVATEVFGSESPRAITASLRTPSVRAPTASIRAPSIKPTASTQAESIAPTIPTKDFPRPFPAAEEPEPVVFPAPSGAPAADSSAPAPIAFPKTDDSRSVDSGSQTHVRLPTSITFDTTATPPRVSTPDPTGASSSPEAEGKRKRISSQNFQRLARRISLSTPKKPTIPSIPGIAGIAGIAGVLRRDTSIKLDKGNGENGGRQSTDATGGSSSAPETARNSGEISAERTEKDKEREEKKRKRKSFMEVVGAIRGDSSVVGTPSTTEAEPQGPTTSEP